MPLSPSGGSGPSSRQHTPSDSQTIQHFPCRQLTCSFACFKRRLPPAPAATWPTKRPKLRLRSCVETDPKYMTAPSISSSASRIISSQSKSKCCVFSYSSAFHPHVLTIHLRPDALSSPKGTLCIPVLPSTLNSASGTEKHTSILSGSYHFQSSFSLH